MGLDEHRDYIHDSTNENAEEDDYKTDAPVGIDAEYTVQLKSQAATLPENWGNLDAGLEEHRDYIHESTNEHAEEDDYKTDAPVGIETEYEVQLRSQTGTVPENWGKLDYGLDEHRDYINDSTNENSEEEEYKLDAPVGIDATYDLQLRNLENANIRTNNKKWGTIAFEDTAEAVNANMVKWSHPPRYVDDMPVDYVDGVKNVEKYDIE